jgi:alpha-L-fucosidase 2
LLSSGEKCAIDLGTTCDMNLIYDLLTNCIAATAVLSEDYAFSARLERAVSKLAPLQKGKHGQLLEWSQDFAEAYPGHRHVSHLVGVYPGKRISEINNPDFLEAAKVSIQRRLDQGGGGTGWGLAWLICLQARLKQPQKAAAGIQAWLNKSVYDNLFDLHPPLSETEQEVYQIDGNFGLAAGVAEMLVQSHNDSIEVLPSLPGSWPSGYIRGLRARGAFELDIEWQNGVLTTLKVKADQGGRCQIRYQQKTIDLMTEIGECYLLDSQMNVLN